MEYDALNRMKKMVYPEDEDTERKELIPQYNRAGALEKITMDSDTYVEHIAYNAKGQRLLIAFDNDVMTRYVYDNNTFRLSRMRSEKYIKNGWTYEPQSGTTKNDVAYKYDLAGNIIQMIDKTPQAAKGPYDLTRNFNYDALYRLLSATGRECDNPAPSPPWDDTVRCTDPTATRTYARQYAYDKMGNILQLKHTASGGNFTRDLNYITSSNNHLNSIDVGANNYAFTYDEKGNLAQENSNRHFEWDHSDQLRAFYDQTGTSEPTVYEHYLYDTSGNRIKKITRKSNGSYPYEVTVYIDSIYEKSYKWDGTSSYMEKKNELHVMDDKSRIAMKRIGFNDNTPEVKYVLDNHLGSSTTILESNASVYNREEYFPFGETSFGSFGKKRYRYVGKEKDEYSGLYYYGARYYNAWMARFVSIDLLFDNYPHYSPYIYAGNKPVNLIDLNGLQEEDKGTVNEGANNISDVGSGADNGNGSIISTGKAPELNINHEELAQKYAVEEALKTIKTDLTNVLYKEVLQTPSIRKLAFDERATLEQITKATISESLVPDPNDPATFYLIAGEKEALKIDANPLVEEVKGKIKSELQERTGIKDPIAETKKIIKDAVSKWAKEQIGKMLTKSKLLTTEQTKILFAKLTKLSNVASLTWDLATSPKSLGKSREDAKIAARNAIGDFVFKIQMRNASINNYNLYQNIPARIDNTGNLR